MSIFSIEDVVNEIKQYCDNKTLVSFLLCNKLSINYLKNHKKEVHNQALFRELNHCIRNGEKTTNVRLNDRLCNNKHNFRVIKINDMLYAAKTNIYGNIISNEYYKLRAAGNDIELQKYPHIFWVVTYGILLYKEGPIATSINSPYLKYKTVARNSIGLKPEINMMVIIKNKITASVYEYYIKYIDGKVMILEKIKNRNTLTFNYVDGRWKTNSKYSIYKIGGFI